MTEKTSSLFSYIQEYRAEYRELFLAAFKEGLSLVREANDSGKYIGTHFDFPKLNFGKNGLPQLSSTTGSCPVDYSGCFFSFSGKPLVNEDEIESFNELVQYVRSRELLLKRFSLAVEPPPEIEIDKIQVLSDVKNSIDRYIHKFNSFEFEAQSVEKVISPVLSYIFDEHLSINICVPILFIDFGIDEHELAPSIAIERISDGEHLARYKVSSYNTSAHESVIHAATHALVLKDWYVPNTERKWDFNILTDARAYPFDIIDRFFGAIRICSTSKTGYGQIYSVAKGWENHYKADLPCVQGVTVRAYPPDFEDYYWNIDHVPPVSSDELKQLTDIFKRLSEASENSISLSLKRLNRCLVRDDEEDAVLDATIALEALLSDDGKQEMTHKLAMRVGALAGFDTLFGRNAAEAFRDIKSIYKYRSAIVHGSKNLEKSRMVKIDDQTHEPAYNLSIDYVRLVLRVLLENERFRDPRQIDQELLLGTPFGA
ncbi:HEPN domain-containing protein [Vreelandella titanicae]|uniref:HEPN domain-containing protein n=1 Tax=Vreelandella titanicae TaxID=664683 RepID=UPI0011417E82|nr:HEPN domain-containing protein [Halomonas titanicae]